MEYGINKGIGKSVELKGLSSQYIIFSVAGLLTLFVVFVILYMIGVGQWFCISFLIVSVLVLTGAVFRINNKYGRYGLMKLTAKKSQPRYLINRKTIYRLFQNNKAL